MSHYKKMGSGHQLLVPIDWVAKKILMTKKMSFEKKQMILVTNKRILKKDKRHW